MNDLVRFIGQDQRINTTELLARIYPNKPRSTAAAVGGRLLAREREPGEEVRDEVQEFVTAATKQVQQLARELLAGLRRPEGRPSTQADAALVKLASDKRLVQKAFYVAVYPELAESTAKRDWKRVRDGKEPLTPAQRRTLRVELQALAAACNTAINK